MNTELLNQIVDRELTKLRAASMGIEALTSDQLKALEILSRILKGSPEIDPPSEPINPVDIAAALARVEAK